MSATLAAGYISIMSSEKDDTIFMMELRECSKRFMTYQNSFFMQWDIPSGVSLKEHAPALKGFS